MIEKRRCRKGDASFVDVVALELRLFEIRIMFSGIL